MKPLKMVSVMLFRPSQNEQCSTLERHGPVLSDHDVSCIITARPKWGIRIVCQLRVPVRLRSIDFFSSNRLGLSARRCSGRNPARCSLGTFGGTSASHPW